MKSSQKLNSIIADKTSGSSELLQELHEHLKSERRLLHAFPEILDLVKNHFNTFQNIKSYLRDLEISLKKQKNLDEFFIRYDNKLFNVYDKIFNSNQNLLLRYNKILTLSNSKTVFEILKRIKHHGKNIKVIVSESRPKFEGRILAKKLIKEKINVVLITEAMLYDAIRNCECTFIGADSILRDGSVVNKVGSSVIATLCKYQKKPLFVVADKSKFSTTNSFKKKEMPPNEIWRHDNPKLKIENYYFERIDRIFIKKIITD